MDWTNDQGAEWTVRACLSDRADFQCIGSTPDRQFRRQLGQLELAFLRDAHKDRVADSISHQVFNATDVTLVHIQQAWDHCRARHPLLAARIEGKQFVVDEQQRRDGLLAIEDAKALAEELWRRTPNLELDDNRLSRLWVQVTETGFEWVLVLPHVISDAVSTFVVTRTMLELIADGPKPLDDLAIRLRQLVSSEAQLLDGQPRRSPRSLWRFAIARVTLQLRRDRLSCGTAFTRRDHPLSGPPHAQSVSYHLSSDQSAAIRAFCREHGISYADLHTAIARLAYTRMMHRLRANGEIQDDEWELRKILPITLGAPMNIRSYCNSNMNEVLACIGYRDEGMPAMRTFDDGRIPTWDELSTVERVVHIARKLANHRRRLHAHPLIREILFLRSVGRMDMARKPSPSPSASKTVSEEKLLMALIGGSIGDMDRICPSRIGEIEFVEHNNYLRVRRGEWYLGTRGFAGRIRLFLTYDSTTYDDVLARQYIDDLYDALKHFVL